MSALEPAEMVEKYADRLVKVMGEVAPEAWEMLVRGQMAMGIRSLVVAGMCACAVVGAAFAIRSVWRSDMDFSDRGPAAVIIGLVALIPTVKMVVSLADAALYLLSPEYMALRELLGR